MPKRVAVNSVFVYRDGKQVRIAPNQAFDFTAEELADIKAHNPDAVRTPNAPEVTDDERLQADAAATAKVEAERVAKEEAAAKAKVDAAKTAAAAKTVTASKTSGKTDASEI